MKIIATIPKPYADPRFIVEVSSEELSTLCLNPFAYPRVQITTATNSKLERAIKDLEPGDTILPEIIHVIRNNIRDFLDSREEINTMIKNLRTALTKLTNVKF
jgi:hypothetical protein